MVLDHLNSNFFQTQGVPRLDHLNNSNHLDYSLKIFLVTCRVNGLSPRSIQDYSQKIGAFVNFCRQTGLEKINDVTPNHIRYFLLERQQKCKPVSVHDYYGCVNRFFNWLIEEGSLETSPMAKMHPPKVPKTLIKPMQTDHINTLLALCDDSLMGLRNRAIILTLLDTGLRRSELSAIKLNEIDINTGVIHVMGKGAKERLVRMGLKAQKAVLRYLLKRNDDLPWLWINQTGQQLQPGGIHMIFRRLRDRANITDIRCSAHTLRHTFGTKALELGADIRQVQTLLGHSTLTMTLKYVATVTSQQAVIQHEKFSPVDRLGLH